MNKVLIDNWNSLIKPEDVIYHMGDVSFKPDKFVDKLNGKIILIYGNHDKKKFNYLYSEVKQTQELKIAEFKCLLTHIPIDPQIQYKKGMCPDFSILKKYDYIIHGHNHAEQHNCVSGKHVNVGVDAWDMKPIHIDELAKFLRKVKFKKHIQLL